MLSAFEEVRSPTVDYATGAALPTLDVGLVSFEVARGHSALRAEARQQALDDVERDVRDDEARRWELVDECVALERGDGDTIHAGVRKGHLDRVGVDVDPDDRPEAELRRSDREDAGAAAHVEQAAALELLEQLEGEPRRRVPAGAEGSPRIDHDRIAALGRVLPRRPDPEAADDDTVVEGAPVALPAVGDRFRGDVETLAERELAVAVGVDDETALDLLDPLREEIEQLRELGLAACDDDASQRNALFSFSKKPSSLR